MATAAHTLSLGRARRTTGHAARVLLFASVALLVMVVSLPLLGLRTLIVRSGSMAPAIETGDVVVSKIVDPDEVRVGDVVTFRDPSRDGVLVTHRVARVRDEGSRFAFVTRGDANGGSESWSIDRSGTLGRVVFRLPKVGYLLAWSVQPLVRAGFMIGAAVILAVVLLRRIWRRDEGS